MGNDSNEIILKYFPDLSEKQKERFKELGRFYADWNMKINVISRKDIDNLYLHHVLHSLAIAKYIKFMPQETVLDVGTGGGFPGIPLAIMYPDAEFTLCDSIGKKLKVIDSISHSLELSNIKTVHSRVEEIDCKFDYIVSRAVTELGNFLPWVKGKYSKGILYLKGGDITNNLEFSERGQLRQEIDKAINKNKIDRKSVKIYNLEELFAEDFFKEKRLIAISR